MSKINKALLAIFVLLLLFTVGEIIYYFLVIAPKKTADTNKISTPINVTAPTISSNPKPTIEPNQAITEDTINSLKALRKDILISSQMTNEYKGRITMLDTRGGTIPTNEGPYAYKVWLVIRGENNGGTGFYYSEANLKLLNVYQAKDNSQAPITINDLKVYDTVTIKETIDLKKHPSNNIIETIITKI